MIGDRILHYKILEKLGEGGMGIVYKAEDTKLGRTVALKMLPPHLLISDDDKARFQREAKAAAALSHANIATVFEINEHEGTPFIAMEFIDGKTLNHHIEKGPFKLQDAINVAIQVAEGLKAAHTKDIVHRDIKSSNIILDSNRHAKILDFGLAKTSMSTKLTQMGTTIGTVAYMSPEQVQGKEVDHRTDLWSLGVLLYEMIAGHMPFKAEYDQAIFYSIQNEEPEPLTAIRTGVPMSLEWIVNKLMAKNPAERYQSAQDLIIDLKASDVSDGGFSRTTKRTVQKTAIHNETIKTPSGNFYKPIAIVSTIFLIYFIVQYFILTNKKPTESLHFNITAIEDDNVHLFKSDMQVIAISPQGDKIAYIVIEGVNTTLYVKSLRNFKTIKLSGLGAVSGEPFFSPDGNYLAFNADGQLKRVSLSSGTVDVINDKPVNRGATWVDDNTIIYAPSYSSGLLTLNISEGTTNALTELDSLRGERTHRWPQILPDGKHVIFTIGNVNSPNSYENAELAIFSLEDKTKHILPIKGEIARFLEPDYLIIGRDGKLLAAPFDMDKYKFVSTPVPVLNEVEGDVGSGISFFGLSATGNIVYLRGTRNQSMQVVRLNKKGVIETLPMPENPYLLPRISPDGKKILINVGTQSTSRDVWIFNLETQLFRRLTFGMAGLYPEWSRNSDGIYFFSTKGSAAELQYLSLNNGSARIIKKYNSSNSISIMSVSPDDAFILLNVMGDNNQWVIEVLNPNTKESKRLSIPGRVWGGNFSPDGKYIAYISNVTDIQEIYVMKYPEYDLKWQISNNGGFSPRWSADGKRLYYINMNGRMMEVPIQMKPVFLPGKPQELRDVSQMFFPSDNADNYDVSPDGDHFIMIKNSSTQIQLNSFNMIYNWTAELDKTFKK